MKGKEKEKGKLENWADKVFDLKNEMKTPIDGRQKPQIELSRAVSAMFWGSVFRLGATHAVEESCREGPLSGRVGFISEDVIRDALERMDGESLGLFWAGVLKKAKTKQMLASDLGGGLVFVCLDGIEIFSSYSRCCKDCLTREVTVKKNGVEIKRTQYYHRVVVACLIGGDFPAPLGVEPVLPGGDEVAAGKRLLEKLRKRLGKRFFDVVVADALYMQAPFFNFVVEQGWEAVFCLKENQPELLAEARRLMENRDPDSVLEQGPTYKRMLWDEPEVYWDAGRRSVRVVKSIEEKTVKRVIGGQKIVTTELVENYWAATLRKVSSQSLFQIGKFRWQIDSNLFADLTRNWAFKHMAVHKPNAYLAVLSLRLMAYLLFMLWVHRQVLSRNPRNLPSLKELSQILYRELERLDGG